MRNAPMYGWAEAQRLSHGWVGDVHVLIGLARLDGIAERCWIVVDEDVEAERLVAEILAS